MSTKQSNRIKVIVADDHPVVRSGLRLFLMAFDDLELCGEASSGEQVMDLCAHVEPDVILMDLLMPGMDGVKATRAIKERHPRVQVIALTSFLRSDLVHQAVQAGAISYLLKNVSAHELANAIRAAAAGRATLDPEATRALRQPTPPAMPPAVGQDLTERERQVLGLVIQGLSNEDIAQRLIVSRSTVKFHISNIFSKLGVENRAEAVAVALENHLVEPHGHDKTDS